MSVVEEQIEVNVPVSTVYNQWTQFEEFPKFMEGVESVRQLDDTHLQWQAKVGGKEKSWKAEVLEQEPDQVISWRSTDGAQNDGTVRFQSAGGDKTQITLRIEADPEGIVENIGDALGFLGRRVRGDLERFKEFIESRGQETGAWRGEVQGGTSNAGGGMGSGSMGGSSTEGGSTGGSSMGLGEDSGLGSSGAGVGSSSASDSLNANTGGSTSMGSVGASSDMGSETVTSGTGTSAPAGGPSSVLDELGSTGVGDVSSAGGGLGGGRLPAADSSGILDDGSMSTPGDISGAGGGSATGRTSTDQG